MGFEVDTFVKKVLLIVLSAILVNVAWCNGVSSFLLFFAFIPVLSVVFSQDKLIYAGLSFFSAMFLLLLIGHASAFVEYNEHRIAFLLAFFVDSCLWTLPVLLAFYLGRFVGVKRALLLFPLLYLCQELLQYHWEFSVVWFNLGYGLSDSPFFSGIYHLVGVEGGTLLIMYANVLSYNLFKEKGNRLKQSVPLAIAFACVVVAHVIPPRIKNKQSVQVTVFQPSSEQCKMVEHNLAGQLELLENALDSACFRGSDLLICPESYFVDLKKRPLNVNNIYDHPAIQKLGEISKRYNTPILSGATLVRLYKCEDAPNLTAKKKQDSLFFDLYNGSIFITPNQYIQWRSKQKLVPFSETFPFYRVQNWLYNKGVVSERYNKSYAVEPYSEPYRYGKIAVAPAICYEGLFPNIMSNYITDDVNLQIVLSTGWTNVDQLQFLHERYSALFSSAFAIPLLYVSLNEGSLVFNNGIGRLFGGSICTKTVSINRSSTVASFIARNHVLLLGLIVGVIMVVTYFSKKQGKQW